MQLIDTQDLLASEQSMDSFVAVFRLAWKLFSELNTYEQTRPLTANDIAVADEFAVSGEARR